MDTDKKGEVEPAVVPSDLQPAPPSKAASLHSGEPDNEKKYETIQTIKMSEPRPTNNLKPSASIVNSSLNLLPTIESQRQVVRNRCTANVKLGVIQLVLSILLSAFGGLLIARNASMSMMGSGVWSGIFAGISGALGIMNIKPLLNGFLACSLISVASSTLALALTGIGLVRDYNISQQDPELEAAVIAACGLTFLLILHLLTSMFSVYYSALELCSNKEVYSADNMNYEKVQKYLKSLQNAGIANCDLNGYQNYINNAKLHSQRSTMQRPPSHPQPQLYHVPIYAPVSAASSYMANPRLYTLPHSYQSNFYQDSEFPYYYPKEERRSPRDNERGDRRKKSKAEDANLSYTGVDRDLAESYLKSIEAKENQHL